MRNRPTPTTTDVQKMAAACQSEATKNKRLKERGAIGASGVQSHEDEQIANAGAAALT